MTTYDITQNAIIFFTGLPTPPPLPYLVNQYLEIDSNDPGGPDRLVAQGQAGPDGTVRNRFDNITMPWQSTAYWPQTFFEAGQELPQGYNIWSTYETDDPQRLDGTNAGLVDPGTINFFYYLVTGALPDKTKSTLVVLMGGSANPGVDTEQTVITPDAAVGGTLRYLIPAYGTLLPLGVVSGSIAIIFNANIGASTIDVTNPTGVDVPNRLVKTYPNAVCSNDVIIESLP